ncbi:hypothetical protein [Yoonia sediminilitoris]|uniref:Aspartate carbamoyltransferase catalytic subunit n=1 Tax=Yoonia sediminilitoris TaxID=1286148 RepID=A0A2T6KIA1_9RHOB|nr:hypothetical protein [Yoonia sediminilitoris]PUB15452.1 hypothetical protein C8N45_10472 [Yoonia sediminilitoris]RCW96062.1 hypothetical protein DFP92_10472 [Yoonia sediminilitoris]
MSINIPANDFGQIRIFEARTDLPQEVLDKTPEGLRLLLGTDALDPNYIDTVRIKDLSSMQLVDYIQQGYDMQAAPYDVPALNGIEGYAVLVMSAASRGQAVTLTPAPWLRHVTTLVPKAQLEVITPLSSTSAQGVIGDAPVKEPKSDARIGGMVATFALIVMFLLVAVMVWVA